MEKDLEDWYKKKISLESLGICFELNELEVFDFFYLI